MPDDQDTSGVAGPVHPPPKPLPSLSRPLWLLGISIVFQVATVIALLLDYCDLATILAILALIFSGAAFIVMKVTTQDEQDTSGVAGPVHPPP